MTKQRSSKSKGRANPKASPPERKKQAIKDSKK